MIKACHRGVAAILVIAAAMQYGCGDSPQNKTQPNTSLDLPVTATHRVIEEPGIATPEGPLVRVASAPTHTPLSCPPPASSPSVGSVTAPPNWESVRREWIYAEPEQRITMANAFIDYANGQVENETDVANEVQAAVRTFVLANITTEPDSRVVSHLLPTLATMPRQEAEPALVAIVGTRSLSTEVRAMAAEILIDSGAWTANFARQWIIAHASSEAELAELLSELRDAGH